MTGFLAESVGPLHVGLWHESWFSPSCPPWTFGTKQHSFQHLCLYPCSESPFLVPLLFLPHPSEFISSIPFLGTFSVALLSQTESLAMLNIPPSLPNCRYSLEFQCCVQSRCRQPQVSTTATQQWALWRSFIELLWHLKHCVEYSFSHNNVKSIWTWWGRWCSERVRLTRCPSQSKAEAGWSPGLSRVLCLNEHLSFRVLRHFIRWNWINLTFRTLSPEYSCDWQNVCDLRWNPETFTFPN